MHVAIRSGYSFCDFVVRYLVAVVRISVALFDVIRDQVLVLTLDPFFFFFLQNPRPYITCIVIVAEAWKCGNEGMIKRFLCNDELFIKHFAFYSNNLIITLLHYWFLWFCCNIIGCGDTRYNFLYDLRSGFVVPRPYIRFVWKVRSPLTFLHLQRIFL